jgi:hypothetical protein
LPTERTRDAFDRECLAGVSVGEQPHSFVDVAPRRRGASPNQGAAGSPLAGGEENIEVVKALLRRVQLL